MSPYGLACDQDFGFGSGGMDDFTRIAKANGLDADDQASHFSEVIPVFHQDVYHPRLTTLNSETFVTDAELAESEGVKKNLA